RTMFALGLFDSPAQITPLPEQEHGQLAREIACKGIVLLKNTDGLLPLSSHELRSLAVIGGDADQYITGGGSSFVKPTYSVMTPQEFNYAISVRWTGSLTVPVNGDYTLSLTHLGTARLFLDDRLLIDDPGITLQTQSVMVPLVAGQPHALRIEYAADRPE